MKRKKKLLFGFVEYTGTIGKKKKDPNEVKDPRPPSENEMAVRLKFALVTRFLAKANTLIKLGYKKKVKKYSSPMNIAVKETLRDAVTGEFPNFSIDYSKVVISTGSLDEPWETFMLPIGGAGIRISWLISRYMSKSSDITDMAMVFLYCEQTDQGVTVEQAAKRDDLGLTIELDKGFAGYHWHAWIFFISENKKLVSDSVYLEEIKLVE